MRIWKYVRNIVFLLVIKYMSNLILRENRFNILIAKVFSLTTFSLMYIKINKKSYQPS